jgi:hypothetical protein
MSVALPLVEEIPPEWTPEAVFLRLVDAPHCLFLDSAMQHPHLGRYSFVAADPLDYLEAAVDGPDGLTGTSGPVVAVFRAGCSGLAAISGRCGGVVRL